MDRFLKYIFVILLFVSVRAFAQLDKDRLVNLHGKKYYQHIVKKGETVYGVSKDFNLPVKDIVLENPKAIDGISPGDTLQIPFIVPGAVPSKPKEVVDSTAYIYHKVQAKETLYSLSKEYNVRIAILDTLNPELKESALKIGMVLRIPKNDGNKAVQVAPPNAKADTSKEKQAFKNLVNGLSSSQPKEEGKLLKRYDIVLMLTFSPQEADSIKMSHVIEGTQSLPLLVQIANDFYSGFKLALDSLAMQGFNTDLHVYNIPPDSADRRIDSILALPSTAASNLIIGPPYPSLFNRIAKFAIQHKIPIVSPLSGDNSVLKDDPFATKAVPSSATEIEQTADYVAAHHHGDNIILVQNPDAANDNFYDLFKKRIKATLSVIDAKDSIQEARYTDALDNIGHTFSNQKINVIVVPYQGASFVPKLVNQLANSKYNDGTVIIYGMHNWGSMDVLDPNNLDTLHLHFASNEFVDYNDRNLMRFLEKYKMLYGSEPLYYAFQGFDIGYYYGNLLKKYGTGLQDHLGGEKYKGVHTSFDFYKPDPTGGYENKAIYMIEYKNYNLVKDTL